MQKQNVYKRTRGYYSVLIRNEVLVHTIARAKLKSILSEVNQAQRDKYCIVTLT